MKKNYTGLTASMDNMGTILIVPCIGKNSLLVRVFHVEEYTTVDTARRCYGMSIKLPF